MRGLILPAELVVISERMFEERADSPGTVYFDAKREDELLYERGGACATISLDSLDA
jgi:hypothetical protein